jgi:hypothetical protein
MPAGDDELQRMRARGTEQRGVEIVVMPSRPRPQRHARRTRLVIDNRGATPTSGITPGYTPPAPSACSTPTTCRTSGPRCSSPTKRPRRYPSSSGALCRTGQRIAAPLCRSRPPRCASRRPRSGPDRRSSTTHTDHKTIACARPRELAASLRCRRRSGTGAVETRSIAMNAFFAMEIEKTKKRPQRRSAALRLAAGRGRTASRSRDHGLARARPPHRARRCQLAVKKRDDL